MYMVENGHKRERKRVEHGHYAEEYPVERVLAVFDERGDSSEPLTSSEVADELGCSTQTGRNKLDALVNRGDLRTKQIGARARVWWRPEGDDSDE